MRKLEGIVVVPTEILSGEWLYDPEEDSWCVLDFDTMECAFFDHEPTEQEIANTNAWWPIETPSKEDKEAICRWLCR